VDIEIAHLPGFEQSSDTNDGIPLCFDCHARIGHYNRRHPRGNKYDAAELRARREQVYEEYTRHLIPPITHQITQVTVSGAIRSLPDVGFNLVHSGDSLPVRVLVAADIAVDRRSLGPPVGEGLYSGKLPWNMNPQHVIAGHFDLPSKSIEDLSRRLEVSISITVVDQYERHHALLPMSWIFLRTENNWFAHPVVGT
jgi:hypothetical protein